MLNEKRLYDILDKYDIHVANTEYFLLAMTHSSYANEHNLKSNERIEFLGDAVLGFLVAQYIYNNFPNMPEGKMSKLRATYVCENANAKYATVIGIDQLLLLGKGEEQSGGRQKEAVINDAFESFLGAVYLTNGLDDVKKILEKVVFPHIKANDQIEFVDYKSQLQEYIQAETRSSLVYTLVNREGASNDPTFTMEVVLEGIVLGRGIGKSKKEASQLAAKNALSKMAKNDKISD